MKKCDDYCIAICDYCTHFKWFNRESDDEFDGKCEIDNLKKYAMDSCNV